ncbi:MAG: hypothetical protein R3F34_04860 [Planctomycetota bacterium]
MRALANSAAHGGSVVVALDRVRWTHPAVRDAAFGVFGPPRMRAWVVASAFHREGGAVDWVGMGDVVERAVRMLDAAVTEHGEDPLWRRVALGIAGLGDLEARLGLRHGGEEALALAQRVASTIAERAQRTSERLAESSGSFGAWRSTRWAALGRPRRNALLSASWSSDGLCAAAGVSEGTLPAVEVRGDVGTRARAATAAAVQRVFEGFVHADFVVDDPDRAAAAVAREVLDRDLQCVSLERESSLELVPRRARTGAPRMEVAPAVRLEAPARGGRWTVYVGLDASGLVEREIVAVSVPLGSDGRRLVELLDQRLAGGGGLESALEDYDCGDAGLRALLEGYVQGRESRGPAPLPRS